MSVRAKFRCTKVEHVYTGNPDVAVANISLAPVWEQEGVNKKWSQATPNGKIEMTITVPESVAFFELGAEVFVDFTLA